MNKIIRNPYKVFSYLGMKGYFKYLDDKTYLKLVYRGFFNKKLNLENPRTYNEKLQWLKLNDRNREYKTLVDKYEVRKHIEEQIGDKYLIPLLGVWDNFEQINFAELPDQFVLKCTHDSGGILICRDKNKLEINKVRNIIEKSLKNNFYYIGREWPYKEIKPRIICEKYLVDDSKVGLRDYKFFCFDGDVRAMFVATDRGIDTKFDYYDLNFNHLDIKQYYKNSSKEIYKPKGFKEMIELAKILSKGYPHVRVDFYDVNGRVYFGEMTFYHFSGFVKFEPSKWDNIFGDWIKLPEKSNQDVNLNDPLLK